MLSQLKNVSKLYNGILLKNTFLKSSTIVGSSTSNSLFNNNNNNNNTLIYRSYSSTSKHQDQRDRIMKEKQESLDEEIVTKALDEQYDQSKIREEKSDLYDNILLDTFEKKSPSRGVFGLLEGKGGVVSRDVDETDIDLREILERDEKQKLEMIKREPKLNKLRRSKISQDNQEDFDDQEDGIDDYEREDREEEAEMGADPNLITREVDLSPGMPKIKEKKRPFQEFNRYGFYNPSNIFAEGLIDLFRDPYAYIDAYTKRYNISPKEYMQQFIQDGIEKYNKNMTPQEREELDNQSNANLIQHFIALKNSLQPEEPIDDHLGFSASDLSESGSLSSSGEDLSESLEEGQESSTSQEAHELSPEEKEFLNDIDNQLNALLQRQEKIAEQSKSSTFFSDVTADSIRIKLNKFFKLKESQGIKFTDEQKANKLKYEIKKYNRSLKGIFNSSQQEKPKQQEPFVGKLINKSFIEKLKKELEEKGDFKKLSPEDELLALQDLKELLKSQASPPSDRELKPSKFVDPAPIIRFYKQLGDGAIARRRLSKLIRFLLKNNDKPSPNVLLTSEEKELLAMRWPNRSASYDLYDEEEPFNYDQQAFDHLPRLDENHFTNEEFAAMKDFNEMEVSTAPNADLLYDKERNRSPFFEDDLEDDDDEGVERLYPDLGEEYDEDLDEDEVIKHKSILSDNAYTRQMKAEAKLVFLRHAERYFENINQDIGYKSTGYAFAQTESLESKENNLRREQIHSDKYSVSPDRAHLEDDQEDPFKSLEDSFKDKGKKSGQEEEEEEVEEDEAHALAANNQFNSYPTPSKIYDQVRVLDVARHVKVTKAGRISSYSCLIFAGDGKGTASLGYGKGESAPTALRRSIKDAVKKAFTLDLFNGNTLPSNLDLKYRSTKIRFYKTAQPEGYNIKTYTQAAILPILGLQGVGFRTYGRRGWKNILETIQHKLPEFTNPQEAARLMGKKYVNSNYMYSNNNENNNGGKKTLQELLSDKFQNQVHKDPYDLDVVSEFLYDLEKKPRKKSQKEIDQQEISDTYDYYYGKEKQSNLVSTAYQNTKTHNTQNTNQSRRRVDPMKTGTTERKHQREQKYTSV